MEANNFPDLPVILALDESTNISGISCKLPTEELTPPNMNTGEVSVFTHQNGIKLFQIANSLRIHKAQIKNVEIETNETFKEKSVIGRAIVGTVLFGGIGGIVGAISGIGNKHKTTYILLIEYFDIYTHKQQSILLTSTTDLTPIKNHLQPTTTTNEKKKLIDLARSSAPTTPRTDTTTGKQPTDSETEKKETNTDPDTETEKKATPGKSNYICNFFDTSGNISDKNIIYCLQNLGESIVKKELQKTGMTKSDIKNRIGFLLQKSNIDKDHLPIKTQSGCFSVIALLLALSALALLF